MGNVDFWPVSPSKEFKASSISSNSFSIASPVLTGSGCSTAGADWVINLPANLDRWLPKVVPIGKRDFGARGVRDTLSGLLAGKEEDNEVILIADTAACFSSTTFGLSLLGTDF
jgi:hypothetical protein